MTSQSETDPVRATVLVVDDDATLLKVMARALTAAGYSVLAEANPQDALACFDGQRIDLVVTDFDMPGMTGAALIERVREISPSTKALLISGAAGHGPEAAGVPLLEKPFAPHRLIAAVREQLGGGPEPGGVPDEAFAARLRELESAVARLEERTARLESEPGGGPESGPESGPPEKI